MSPVAPEVVLAAKLQELFAKICEQSDRLSDLPDRQATGQVAAWSVVQEVNAVAADVAERNRYLRRSLTGRQRRPVSVHWGRALDGDALHYLGVVGVLRSRRSVPDDLCGQVMAFLAGPSIPIQRHVVINANLDLAEPVEVAGWQLWRPTREELDSVRPVQAAMAYAPSSGWDPLLFEGTCSMLSRIDAEANPRSHVTRLLPAFIMDEIFGPELSIAAWPPLLLLNLFCDDPVSVVSEYEVEPGRFMEMVRGERLTTTIIGGPGDEHEIVAFGPFWASGAKLASLLRFLALLSDHLDGWLPRRRMAHQKGHPFHRLQRSAQRLLSLNPCIGYDGTVVFRRRSGEVVLWCVAALEHLLTSAGERDGDLTRRVAQRAAVLVGHDDEHRLQIEEFVKSGYRVRSLLAHGDAPSDSGTTEALAESMRRLLREAITRRIVLGPEIDIAMSCDRALLSASERGSVIAAPYEQFRAAL
ncbi:hypothetical protein ACGFNP_11275 [Nonomuraea sp. NPDC049269]|uniref:hypothetical protein n=1 Tax=Nonomuraea sp. NPDC049269 TaxID=3364349 RepID=UPI003710EE71